MAEAILPTTSPGDWVWVCPFPFLVLAGSGEAAANLARLGRLELPAYRFEVCRSIHLSYRRMQAVYRNF